MLIGANRVQMCLIACMSVVMLLGASFATLWHAKASSRHLQLQVSPTIIKIRGSDYAPGERVGRAFVLRNPSDATITIEEISSTCSCLVPKAARGMRVLPGAELPVEVLVSIPEAGKRAPSLWVYHDGDDNAVEVRIEVTGRRAMPYIEKITDGSPFFAHLASTAETADLKITTIEEFGSQHWLDVLTADNECIAITRGAVTEEVIDSEGVVRRVYEFRIGWHSVPPRREIISSIWATAKTEADSRLFIGEVSALIQTSRIRPTLIQLQTGKVEEEIVLFDHPSQHSNTWKIVENTTLPDWLGLEWQEVSGNSVLRIWLTNAYEGVEPTHLQIPLIRDDAITEQLKVVVFSR